MILPSSCDGCSECGRLGRFCALYLLLSPHPLPPTKVVHLLRIALGLGLIDNGPRSLGATE